MANVSSVYVQIKQKGKSDWLYMAGYNHEITVVRTATDTGLEYSVKSMIPLLTNGWYEIELVSYLDNSDIEVFNNRLAIMDDAFFFRWFNESGFWYVTEATKQNYEIYSPPFHDGITQVKYFLTTKAIEHYDSPKGSNTKISLINGDKEIDITEYVGGWDLAGVDTEALDDSLDDARSKLELMRKRKERKKLRKKLEKLESDLAKMEKDEPVKNISRASLIEIDKTESNNEK